MSENSLSHQPDSARKGAGFTKVLAMSFALAALIVVGLAWQTWRAARDHRNASERVLKDYASFAAWSFASRVRSATFLAINPIFDGAERALNSNRPIVRGMRDVADSLETCNCGVDLDPQLVFAMDLASSGAAIDRRDSALTQQQSDLRAGVIRQKIIASLKKGVSSRVPGALPYRWITDASADPWIAFYSVRFRSVDDPGVVAGFEMRAATFARRVLAPAFAYSPLLPPSLVRSASIDSLIVLNVSASDSKSLYQSPGQLDLRYSAAETLGEPDTVLVARVAINPAAANQLIIGGLPASPVVTVFPLVSLAIALLLGTYVLARKRETQALELRASLSDARLAALRAQIHPHFLFNVLNSAVMLARKGDSKAVVGTLTRLSDLLRVLLRDGSRDEVELREELQLVRQYLELEQVRFRDRLEIHVADPGDLATALVPTLILQPLAENALKHGIASMEAGGVVSVHARRDGRFLVLEVRDNGKGPGSNLQSVAGSGIGLRNSRERLKQLYGDQTTIDLESPASGGTLAAVRIPLKWRPTTPA